MATPFQTCLSESWDLQHIEQAETWIVLVSNSVSRPCLDHVALVQCGFDAPLSGHIPGEAELETLDWRTLNLDVSYIVILLQYERVRPTAHFICIQKATLGIFYKEQSDFIVLLSQVWQWKLNFGKKRTLKQQNQPGGLVHFCCL